MHSMLVAQGRRDIKISKSNKSITNFKEKELSRRSGGGCREGGGGGGRGNKSRILGKGASSIDA